MYRFCVWVDADSFPARARAFLVELAVSKSVRVVFVANRDIKTNNKTVQMIVCQKEKDSADNYIFENAGANDIVVTRDLLFAERLVSKKITVMNDRGVVFTRESIADKLREREFSLNLSEIGLGGGKGNYYGDKEFKKFSVAFAEELQKHIIADIYNIKK